MLSIQSVAFFVVVLITTVSGKDHKRVSFTSEGSWTNATDDECAHFLCSPKRETWRPTNYPQYRFYNATTGCQALLSKNISQIHFHGDSYMRQIYSAMLITLLGNYQYGSIRDPNASPKCSYHRQFNEKTCGLKELNHEGWICDKKILLDPLLTGIDNVNDCKPGHVKLWSFGNHQLQRGRFGVNDPVAYSSMFDRSVCPSVKQATESGRFDGTHLHNSCSIYWVSTHWRIVGWFDDEKEPIVYHFNRAMRDYFDSGRCGPVNYIDVYNMTYGLRNKTENVDMSYDRVHWGMEVNLVKAQVILNAILSQ